MSSRAENENEKMRRYRYPNSIIVFSPHPKEYFEYKMGCTAAAAAARSTVLECTQFSKQGASEAQAF